MIQKLLYLSIKKYIAKCFLIFVTNFLKEKHNILILFTYHSFTIFIFLCWTFKMYFLKNMPNYNRPYIYCIKHISYFINYMLLTQFFYPQLIFVILADVKFFAWINFLYTFESTINITFLLIRKHWADFLCVNRISV